MRQGFFGRVPLAGIGRSRSTPSPQLTGYAEAWVDWIAKQICKILEANYGETRAAEKALYQEEFDRWYGKVSDDAADEGALAKFVAVRCPNLMISFNTMRADFLRRERELKDERRRPALLPPFKPTEPDVPSEDPYERGRRRLTPPPSTPTGAGGTGIPTGSSTASATPIATRARQPWEPAVPYSTDLQRQVDSYMQRLQEFSTRPPANVPTPGSISRYSESFPSTPTGSYRPSPGGLVSTALGPAASITPGMIAPTGGAASLVGSRYPVQNLKGSEPIMGGRRIKVLNLRRS